MFSSGGNELAASGRGFKSWLRFASDDLENLKPEHKSVCFTKMVMNSMLGSKKSIKIDFRENMEFWERLFDLLEFYPKLVGVVIYSKNQQAKKGQVRELFLASNLRQGYAKRSAHEELGAPDVKHPVSFPRNSRAMKVGSLLPSSQVHSPRSSNATASDEVVVEDWGRVLVLGLPGKFVGGDWHSKVMAFTTAAQKMQIPFVRSLEVLLGRLGP